MDHEDYCCLILSVLMVRGYSRFVVWRLLTLEVCFGELKMYIVSILNLSKHIPRNKIVRVMKCKY